MIAVSVAGDSAAGQRWLAAARVIKRLRVSLINTAAIRVNQQQTMLPHVIFHEVPSESSTAERNFERKLDDMTDW